MSEYRRLYRQQGWYFFTVVTYNREKILIQPNNLVRLRHSFRYGMDKYPFSIGTNASLTKRAEKKVWQRRFWEHLLRNEKDWQNHMDYIHYNPVKHGYVRSPGEWLYGSFHHAVKQGLYPADWGAQEPLSIEGMDLE